MPTRDLMGLNGLDRDLTTICKFLNYHQHNPPLWVRSTSWSSFFHVLENTNPMKLKPRGDLRNRLPSSISNFRCFGPNAIDEISLSTEISNNSSQAGVE